MTKEQIKKEWLKFVESYRKVAEEKFTTADYECESMGDETVMVNKVDFDQELANEYLEEMLEEAYGQFIWDHMHDIAPYFMSDHSQLLDDEMVEAVEQWADSEEPSYKEFKKWMES